DSRHRHLPISTAAGFRGREGLAPGGCGDQDEDPEKPIGIFPQAGDDRIGRPASPGTVACRTGKPRGVPLECWEPLTFCAPRGKDIAGRFCDPHVGGSWSLQRQLELVLEPGTELARIPPERPEEGRARIGERDGVERPSEVLRSTDDAVDDYRSRPVNPGSSEDLPRWQQHAPRVPQLRRDDRPAHIAIVEDEDGIAGKRQSHVRKDELARALPASPDLLEKSTAGIKNQRHTLAGENPVAA